MRGGWVYEASSIEADMQSLALDSVRRFLRTAARDAEDADPVNVGPQGIR